jgi:hypothetical protein
MYSLSDEQKEEMRVYLAKIQRIIQSGKAPISITNMLKDMLEKSKHFGGFTLRQKERIDHSYGVIFEPKPQVQYQAVSFADLECATCDSIGYVVVTHEGNDLWALCDCSGAQRHRFKLPLAKDIGPSRIVNHKDFIPESGKVGDIGEKVEWFKEKMRICEQYWKHNNIPTLWN